MKREKQSFLKLYLGLFAINIVFITLAILFYNGIYDNLNYPFSFAGDYQTVGGQSNCLSMYIYGIGMALSGVLMLYATSILKKSKASTLKTLFGLICGIGFLIASLNPDDIRHSFHVLGSAMFIASLWILATSYIVEIRKDIKPMNYYLLQAVLHVPIFVYAGTYFLNIDPLSYILQKFALLGLGFTLIYTSHISDIEKHSTGE